MGNNKQNQTRMKIHHVSFGNMHIIDDGYNYTVHEEHKKWSRTHGHFSTIEGAIKRILRQIIVDKNEEIELSDLIKQYRTQIDRIKKDLSI